jgi:hypothetical protein
LALDTVNGQLEKVRAEHDPAIVYHPGTDSFSELGGSEKASYQMLHIAPSHGIAAACIRRRFSKAGDG